MGGEISTGGLMLTVPPSRRGVLSRMVTVWIQRWWWVVATVLVVPIILALLVDDRWWYVSFMIALMLYPTVMWLVYAWYGTRQEASLTGCKKRVTIDPVKISITYYDTETDCDEPMVSKVIPIRSITSYSANSDSLTIEWGSGVWDYIELPIAVFPSVGDLDQFIAILYEQCGRDI